MTSSLKAVKLFADGANRDEILSMYRNPIVRGFTTNPTLMRKNGVSDYEKFARSLLAGIPDRPFSFEVFADDFKEMERQARTISSWGRNVYVKIPITNTRSESSVPVIRCLSKSGIKVNVTAMTTLGQLRGAVKALGDGPPACVSIFAGRIADTGTDPVPIMAEAVSLLKAEAPHVELIWASPRELLNVIQADNIGCHIITATAEMLRKIELLGRDLTEYSLETVRMFHRDASEAGYIL
jgi:transaldolase